MKKNGSEAKKMSEKLWLATAVGLIVLTLYSASFAQLVGRPDRGYQGGNSYSISDIESVNLSGGNIGMNIPLASLPAGRGTTPGYGISLAYDSKLWNAEQTWETDGTGESQQQANYTRNLLNQTNEGGWHIRTSYRLNVVDRTGAGNYEECFKGNTNYSKNSYRWKIEMQTPGGGSIAFRQDGFSDLYSDGFVEVDLNGFVYQQRYAENFDLQPNCQHNSYQATTAGMTYYSTDGSGIRLFVPYNSQLHNQSTNGNRNWIMYLPDGRTIENLPPSDTNVGQKTVDRNGNYIVVKSGVHNGMSGTKIEDQLGRFIFRGEAANGDTKIIQAGVGGEELETTVKWKQYYVYRNYRAVDLVTNVLIPIEKRTADVIGSFYNVDKIILPAQAGSLTYEFGYHADAEHPTTNTPYTNGWGELASVKTPSESESEYEYDLPANENTLTLASDIIKNSIVGKTLKYDETYDGQTSQKTQSWQYEIHDAITYVTLPDGGVTVQNSYNKSPMFGVSNTWKAGLVLGSRSPDGILVEKIWEQNGTQTGTPLHSMNPYVKTEIINVPNQAGQLSLSAIKDYFYDQNMNLLEVREYDWMTYAEAHPGSGWTGIPNGAVLKRKTVNEYYNPALPMGSTTTNSNHYADPNAPRLLNLIKSTEIRDGNNTPVARSEFFYDSTAGTTATGNLIETRTWDNFKGGASQAYSNPLTTTNSVSASVVYDTYGNPTQTTDAKGTISTITYGSITTPTGTVTGLYPTQTETASNYSALKRTSTAAYDFYTGLVTSATDVDNNVTSGTEYDALGRPIKSKAAVGTPLEIWSTTEYDDVNRRVITRSDIETKGDGKKIAVQHFDQLGRVRLTRQIENVQTEDPYNEDHGIKVQTRYLTGNPHSYQLSSNPYRAATSAAAANEQSMGWTRSKSVNTGKHSEVETYTGAELPAPWGTNTASTGKVQTDIDGERTLVTDQSGKQRISKTSALGQLINVWEVKEADADTEAVSFGSLALNALKTSYQYDTLNNLTTVNQGVQTRSFAYSSLSRLLNADNPEAGVISYQYDNNGNLTGKTDARSITTTYGYDALNRVKTRDYSDTTPDVLYTYDNGTNAKGRLTKVVNGILASGVIANPFSITEYQAFDQMGRVTQSQQTTDGTAYGVPMTYTYNLSGALIEQKYPSGRVVKNVLDNDGDLAIVQSKRNANSGYWNYAKSFTYTAAGAVSSMQLGNSKWESTVFNARLQPMQIALGNVKNATDQLKLNFTYNTANQNDNNGNVLSQTITIPTVGTTPGFTAVQTYTYDSLNRIKEADEKRLGYTQTDCVQNPDKCWKQTFQYDRYGNRTFDEGSVGGQYKTTTLPRNCGTAPNITVCAKDNPQPIAASNKLQGIEYDSAGNTRTDLDNRRFTYDGENKQIKVETTDGNGNVTGTLGEYFYDGDGKRVKKVSLENSQWITTIFVYDASGKMVAEYSTQVSTTPQVSYLTNDHLGSPRITTDQNGQVISRRDFQPFGEEITRANYGTDNVRQKFTSYERDTETDLDFAQARMYANKLGRFTTVDPALSSGVSALPQSWNRYGYTLNNPLLFTDPTGLIWGYKDLEDGKRQFQWFDGDEVGVGFTAYTKTWYVGRDTAFHFDPDSAHWYSVLKEGSFGDEEWWSFQFTLGEMNVELDNQQVQRLNSALTDQIIKRPEVKQTLEILEIAENISSAGLSGKAVKKFAKSILSLGRNPRAISAAVDTTTGRTSFGMSGGEQPSILHSTMQNRINWLNSTGGSRAPWCITNCAEFRAVNDALLNGAELNNLEVHTVKTTSGLPAFQRCPNCQVTTTGTITTSDH